MNRLNYRAIRAFQRVWAPICQSFTIGARADEAIDGGEWSGPANDRSELRAYYRGVARVAHRFGMTVHELDRQIQVADYRETEHMFKRGKVGRSRGSQSADTNVERVTYLMEHSRAGTLIQAFVVTAIERYAAQCIEAGAEQFHNGMLNGVAWIRCAEDAVEWHKRLYPGVPHSKC